MYFSQQHHRSQRSSSLLQSLLAAPSSSTHHFLLVITVPRSIHGTQGAIMPKAQSVTLLPFCTITKCLCTCRGIDIHPLKSQGREGTLFCGHSSPSCSCFKLHTFRWSPPFLPNKTRSTFFKPCSFFLQSHSIPRPSCNCTSLFLCIVLMPYSFLTFLGDTFLLIRPARASSRQTGLFKIINISIGH